MGIKWHIYRIGDKAKFADTTGVVIDDNDILNSERPVRFETVEGNIFNFTIDGRLRVDHYPSLRFTGKSSDAQIKHLEIISEQRRSKIKRIYLAVLVPLAWALGVVFYHIIN